MTENYVDLGFAEASFPLESISVRSTVMRTSAMTPSYSNSQSLFSAPHSMPIASLISDRPWRWQRNSWTGDNDAVTARSLGFIESMIRPSDHHFMAVIV